MKLTVEPVIEDEQVRDDPPPERVAEAIEIASEKTTDGWILMDTFVALFAGLTDDTVGGVTSGAAAVVNDHE